MNVHSFSRRSLVLSTCCALTAALLLSPAVAPTPASAAEAVGSGGGTKIVSGTVTNEQGATAPDAYVTATLWPSQEDYLAEGQSVEKGEAAEAQLLASAKVDKNGRFELQADLMGLRSDSPTVAQEIDALLRGEPVDILIEAYTVDSTNLYAATVTYDPVSDSLVPTSTGENSELASPDSQLVGQKLQGGVRASGIKASTDSSSLDLTIPLVAAEEKGYLLSESEQASAAAAPNIPCYTKTGDYPQVWTVIGAISSTASSGFSATFSHSQGSMSELGVGVSTTGSFGSYTSSGTTQTSSSNSSTWPARTTAGGDTYRTQFSYGKYEGRGCFTGSVVPPKKYFVKVYSHWGGQQSVAQANPGARGNYCASYLAGGSVTMDSGQAATYTNSVKFTGYIGSDLTGKQQYTSGSKVSVSLTQNRSICGYEGAPGSSYVGEITIK